MNTLDRNTDQAIKNIVDFALSKKILYLQIHNMKLMAVVDQTDRLCIIQCDTWSLK